MIIRPAEAELFHADRRTDRHDEANSPFAQFCKNTKKESNPYTHLDRPLELQKSEAPGIRIQSAHKGGRVVTAPAVLTFEEISLLLVSV